MKRAGDVSQITGILSVSRVTPKKGTGLRDEFLRYPAFPPDRILQDPASSTGLIP